jgi:hypothetical protein
VVVICLVVQKFLWGMAPNVKPIELFRSNSRFGFSTSFHEKEEKAI